jgi:membrane-bound metal-dependent hydrolase YbcI (DUF457 family)
MPSPVGHALGGIAAGGAVAHDRLGWRQAALFGVLGLLPDLDLLVGLHSTYTHSIGAATLIGVLAALVPDRTRARWSGAGRASFALACAAAYGSHVLLDWLGSDSTPPIGIMALWPFSSAFYQSDLNVFGAISRRYWLVTFWIMNLTAALREIVLLGPLVLLIAWLRRLTSSRAARAQAG